MASKRDGTLYTGVTSNLAQRVWRHKEGLVEGFTKKYGCKRLVWHELHETMTSAVSREKQIKRGSRAKKLALIEVRNPAGRDLHDEILWLDRFGADAPRDDGFDTYFVHAYLWPLPGRHGEGRFATKQPKSHGSKKAGLLSAADFGLAAKGCTSRSKFAPGAMTALAPNPSYCRAEGKRR